MKGACSAGREAGALLLSRELSGGLRQLWGVRAEDVDDVPVWVVLLHEGFSVRHEVVAAGQLARHPGLLVRVVRLRLDGNRPGHHAVGVLAEAGKFASTLNPGDVSKAAGASIELLQATGAPTDVTLAAGRALELLAKYTG